MEFRATVTQSAQVQWDNAAAWRTCLMRHAGKRIVVQVLTEKRQRTLAQNAYFHGVLLPAFRDAWNAERRQRGESTLTDEQAKYVWKVAFLGSVATSYGPVPAKGTSDCTTEELSHAIDEARRYARETWDMHIPTPDEPWEAIEG